MKKVKIDGKVYEVVDYEQRPHQKELADKVWKRLATGKGPQYLVPVDHRRSGKSTELVNACIKVCSSAPNPGQVYYLYPQQKKIREHIWDNPGILPLLLPMSQVKKKDDQRMVITFKSGWQMIFDGTDENPDKHRGGNGRLYIIDEYDDQQKRVFSEIVRPIIEANGGAAVLSGTPRGIKHLHEAYTAGQDPDRPQWWSRILPATESKDFDGSRLFGDEQLKNIRKDYEADGIGPAYTQEYLCSFNSDSNQVFRKLDQVVIDDFGEELKEREPEPGRVYRIGCDPAITHDYWVNSVWDMHTGHEVYIDRFQPMDSALGEARLEALYRKYNNADIYMDESGLGMIIGDHFRHKGIDITPIKTAQMKERLITNMSIKIDNLDIRLLPDVVAMAEMRDFSFNRLPSGRYQFSAPANKHDDCVIARAIGCWEMDLLPDLEKSKRNWYDKEEVVGGEGHYAKKNNTYFGFKKKQ